MGGVACQEERLLHRRVAAADDRNLLVLEEEAVAGGAAADATRLQALLIGQAQPHRARARRHDDRVRRELLLGGPEVEWPAGEVNAHDIAHDRLRAEALGLRLEFVHHLRPQDAFLEARIVLHVARDHQLAAGLLALEDYRAQIGARRVDRGGVARWPGADDRHIIWRVLTCIVLIRHSASLLLPSCHLRRFYPSHPVKTAGCALLYQLYHTLGGYVTTL